MRFKNQTCENCGKRYDGLRSSCPECGTASPDRKLKGFDHYVHAPFYRQLLLFFGGWLGFQLLALIIQLIMGVVWKADHPGGTAEDLTNFFKTTDALFLHNGLSYLFLIGALALILWSTWKEIFKSFKFAWAPLIGLLGFAATTLCNILYSVSVGNILKAAGFNLSENVNESTVRSIVAAYPWFSLILFGFIGPFCEEVTYRVGLLGFFSRFNKPLGYIISSVVFGLIHFDFACFANGTNAIVIELYNLPQYLGAGALMALVYDFGGFSASLTTHTVNNVYSVIMTIIATRSGS